MGRRKCHCLCLRDGRKLRYMIDGGPDQTLDSDDPSTGNSSSLPVIFAFHAMFLSGASFLQNSPQTDYIVVSPNRPGYHGSCPVTVGEYSYKHFTEDVQELADHLGIDKFSVVGHSSGGPNALACASFLKDRVLSIGIMAGDPEYAVENNPTDDNHDDSLKSQTTHRNKNKHKQSHASPIMDWFLGWCLPNSMRFVPFVQVTNGLKNDYYLERQKWPFRTEEIVQPAVVVLGDQDSILPNEVAVKVHERLPNSKLKMLRGVGHNELLQDDILDMVFRTVVDLAKSSPHGNALSDKDMGTQLLCSSTSG